jgi:hypothetical protein
MLENRRSGLRADTVVRTTKTTLLSVYLLTNFSDFGLDSGIMPTVETRQTVVLNLHVKPASQSHGDRTSIRAAGFNLFFLKLSDEQIQLHFLFTCNFQKSVATPRRAGSRSEPVKLCERTNTNVRRAPVTSGTPSNDKSKPRPAKIIGAATIRATYLFKFE